MYVDKHSANPVNTDFLSEWSVFQMLDKLHITATGMDDLPVWFLASRSRSLYAIARPSVVCRL